MFNFLFSSFFVATANTKIISLSTLVVGVANTILDYGFIFGNFGFPELGIQGAAIASVLAQGMGTITYLVYSNWGVNSWFSKYFVLGGPKISSSVLKELLQTGLPLVGQNFMSMAGWFVFFTLIEKLGERELAVSHVSRSIYALLMTPIFGFSDSANSFVSNAIGAKNYKEIWRIIWRASFSSIGIMVVILIICITFLPQLLSLYTTNAEFIELTKPIMYIIFIAVPLFCLSFVSYRSLAGTGKTQLTFAIELATVAIYCVYLFSGYHYFEFNLLQYWYSEYIYFCTLWSLSLFFLYREIKKLRIAA
jgi:Na+-driven multidrug efflux pump